MTTIPNTRPDERIELSYWALLPHDYDTRSHRAATHTVSSARSAMPRIFGAVPDEERFTLVPGLRVTLGFSYCYR
jgi:hypothetical protein